MKRLKFGLLAVAVVLPGVARAQSSSPIGEGTWIIGGTATLSRMHVDELDQDQTGIRVSPMALRFVKPRFAIGGSALASYGTSGDVHTSGVGIGPAARYYFGDPAGKLFPFINGSVAVAWSKTSGTRPSIDNFPALDVDFSSRQIVTDVSVGLTRILVPHVGLTGEAYYTHRDTHNDSGNVTVAGGGYDFGLRFGFALFVY